MTCRDSGSGESCNLCGGKTRLRTASFDRASYDLLVLLLLLRLLLMLPLLLLLLLLTLFLLLLLLSLFLFLLLLFVSSQVDTFMSETPDGNRVPALVYRDRFVPARLEGQPKLWYKLSKALSAEFNSTVEAENDVNDDPIEKGGWSLSGMVNGLWGDVAPVSVTSGTNGTEN